MDNHDGGGAHREQIKRETTDEDFKQYAETAMNELLGWYGYGATKEDAMIQTTVNSHSNSNSNNSSGPSSPSHAAEGCGWCSKVVEDKTGISVGALTFCSELCFSQSRRANFKKNKTCDWCRHVRHTVSYVDFQDGASQLQFCSDKCLNQYKMHIFCRETRAHLEMHPHLPNDDDNGSGLITPDLWLKNCKSPDRALSASPPGSPKSVNSRELLLSQTSPLPLITVAHPSKLLAQPSSFEESNNNNAGNSNKRKRTPVQRKRKRPPSTTITNVNNFSKSIDLPQDLRIRQSPPILYDSNQIRENSIELRQGYDVRVPPPRPQIFNHHIDHLNFNHHHNNHINHLSINQTNLNQTNLNQKNSNQTNSNLNQTNLSQPNLNHSNINKSLNKSNIQNLHSHNGNIKNQFANVNQTNLNNIEKGQNVLPPVTILVPYPIIIPVPLPIPIPLPIQSFLDAEKTRNKSNKDSSQNNDDSNKDNSVRKIDDNINDTHDKKIFEKDKDNKILNSKLLDNKLINNKLIDNKLIDNKLIDNKLIDNKLIDNKLIDNKLIDNKLIDNKLIDNKLLDKSLDTNLKDNENVIKTIENKTDVPLDRENAENKNDDVTNGITRPLRKRKRLLETESKIKNSKKPVPT